MTAEYQSSGESVQQHGAEARVATPSTSPGACLLLAEDNPVNLLVTRSQLRKLGYTVEVAANGLEALAAHQRAAYPLILMDCHMPEMDGYEAAVEIRRRDPPGRHTVILAMTALAFPEDRDACLAAGMDDCIAKPIKLEELEAKLRKWLAAPGAAAARG